MSSELPKKERDVLILLAGEIGGPRARMLLRYLEGRLFRDDNENTSVCWFDEAIGKLDRIVYARARCPFVLLHEFGHAYHCYYFEKETTGVVAGMGDGVHSIASLEAVATLFEIRLSKMVTRFEHGGPPAGHPHLAQLGTMWSKRSKEIEDWAAADETGTRALDILDKLGYTGDEPIHDLVGRIMSDAGSTPQDGRED